MNSQLLAASCTLILVAIPLLAADGASRTAHLGSMRLHYESFGSGAEAVVFIHGWTCDLTFWREQAPVYAGHRSLLIDLPGHGESDKPYVPYPMELFARGIDAVMRDASVDRAILVGHSLGGPIAYAFLRLYPQKVKAVVLVDAYVAPAQTGPIDRKAQASFYQTRARSLSGAAGRKNFARRIEKMFSAKTPEPLRQEIRAKMLATPEHVRVAAVSSPSLLSPPPVGATYDLPVLGIQASAPGLPARTATMRKMFPNLQVETWEDHGHFLMLEDPERFNRTLENFLSALDETK